MSGFAQALSSYRAGELTRDELFTEVERQLSEGKVDTSSLLQILNEEHAKARLPGDVHAVIARRLLHWRQAPPPWRIHAQASPRTEVQSMQEAAATILIDSPVAQVGSGPAVAELSPLERPAPRQAGLSVGSVLQDRFKLIEQIGEGGMSAVYKAIDLRKVEARASDPHVAVKILTVPLGDFTHSLPVLQGEAQKLQSLPHPNIVRVIDCDRDGRTVFMTMEYLTGESLKRKLEVPDCRGLPTAEALRIVECIASALAFAHRNGIVHGDLKPANVIITEKGEVKIIDFGIARLMTRGHGGVAAIASEQRPWANAFTPLYASPEMLENREPDPRDDIYALACIAHELLTGRHPFDRDAANVARDSGRRLVRRSPVSRSQYRAIAHGIEFDRERRTPTAEQFFSEFRAKALVRADTLAGIAGGSALAVLTIVYFADHSRLIHWLEGRRVTAVATPKIGEVFRDCPTCPLMKALPPGHLRQGAAADDPDATPLERPQHGVAIAYPLGIGVYEVTVGEYREFVDATSRKEAGCRTYEGNWQERADLSWNNVGYAQTAAHPVACVSWQDARDYAAWLSRKTGQQYRLPSDSEWEYAARAGSEAARPWGAQTQSACAHANVADETAERHYPGWTVHRCSDGYVYSAPVGSFEPNEFGLYDMLGNVFEWVQDCWHADYQNAPSDGSAWLDGDCSQHDMRGGSWFTAPSRVSVMARNRFAQDYRSNTVGFRLIREIQK